MKKQMRKGIFDAVLVVSAIWAAAFLGKASYTLFGNVFAYWLIGSTGIGIFQGSFVRIGVLSAKDDIKSVVRLIAYLACSFPLAVILTKVLNAEFMELPVPFSGAGSLIGWIGSLAIVGFSPFIFAKKDLKSIARLARLQSK